MLKFGDARYTTFDDPGPAYPALGNTVQKYRRMARNGIKSTDRATVEAYAAEVSKAILRLQRTELQRELPSFRPNCASGTAYTRGEDITAAIRRQQNSTLLACPGRLRRDRDDQTWREMYAEAMEEKAARTKQKTVESLGSRSQQGGAPR